MPAFSVLLTMEPESLYKMYEYPMARYIQHKNTSDLYLANMIESARHIASTVRWIKAHHSWSMLNGLLGDHREFMRQYSLYLHTSQGDSMDYTALMQTLLPDLLEKLGIAVDMNNWMIAILLTK